MRQKKRTETKRKTFSLQQLQNILLTCKKEEPNYYLLMLICSTTGIRISEALGLQFENVDFSNRQLHIIWQKGRTIYGDGWESQMATSQLIQTKTYSSVRNVEIPQFVLDEIILAKNKYDYLNQNDVNFHYTPDFVVVNSNGRPLSRDFKISHAFKHAALLAAKYTSSIFSNDEIVLILRKAIELLRDEGKLFLLPEIIKEYEKYNNIITEKNDLTRFINARKSLIEIGKIYKINYNKLRLFEQISRNFKLDYEIIRKNRIAEKMSQEKMSEEVCTRETLSRIERGVTCPTQKNLEKLLLKLNREGKRVDTEIITDFTVLEKKKKYSTYVYRLEYDKADLILEELKDDLDQTIKKNKQYILGEELRRKLRDGILSYEEAIILLYEILNLTVNVKNIFEYTLTSYEINLLNQIAIIYSKNGNINLGIEIYKEILRNLDESELEVIFRMQDWDLIMSNQASFLEINNQPQNAIELTQNRIKTTLEIGRGIDLGRALSTMACALEQENKTDCKYYFNWSADILFLMKNYKRYELIRKYLD